MQIQNLNAVELSSLKFHCSLDYLAPCHRSNTMLIPWHIFNDIEGDLKYVIARHAEKKVCDI